MVFDPLLFRNSMLGGFLLHAQPFSLKNHLCYWDCRLTIMSHDSDYSLLQPDLRQVDISRTGPVLGSVFDLVL